MIGHFSQAQRTDAEYHSSRKEAWMRGLERYQKSFYQRKETSHSIVWQKNQVTLCKILPSSDDKKNAPVLLLVPSLINRNYILDLTEELSLARYMAAEGNHIYLIDWGKPSESDAAYDAGDYIINYLCDMVEWLSGQHDCRISIVGYCIGGLLSLALAQLKPEFIHKLILLATPWDFSKHQGAHGVWGAWQAAVTESWCRAAPLVPGAYLSWLFYLADPTRFEDKYCYFATLQQDTEAYDRFMAIEYWVNDAVPLTRAFARTCLIEWAQCNTTGNGLWKVAGQTIDPEQIYIPTLLVAPKRDHIVPPASSMALANKLPLSHILMPDTGHIGMIIGRTRYSALWHPLREWMQDH